MTDRLGRLAIAAATVVLMGAASIAVAAEDAAALYKAKCAGCHAADGSGSTPIGKNLKVRDLRSDEVQKKTDVQLTDTIAGGKGKMPPFGKSLSGPQIQMLIAHLRTMKK